MIGVKGRICQTNMEDYAVKLVRPFEDLIKTFAKVLQEERDATPDRGYFTYDEMMKSAMTIGRGHHNPNQVKEFVDKIFNERGIPLPTN